MDVQSFVHVQSRALNRVSSQSGLRLFFFQTGLLKLRSVFSSTEWVARAQVIDQLRMSWIAATKNAV